jgi:hypothetical protein
MRIAGWPAGDGERTFGLKPTCDYAFDATPMELLGCAKWLNVGSLTPGVCIDRACGGEEGFILRFCPLSEGQSAGNTATVTLRKPVAVLVEASPSGRALRIIRDVAAGTSIDVNLESAAALIGLASDATLYPAVGDYLPISRAYFVEHQTGIERGHSYQAVSRKVMAVDGSATPIPMQTVSGGDDAEICIDYIVSPAGQLTTAEFYFQNTSDTHGNGSELGVLVNGIEVLRRDLAPTKETNGGAGREWDLDGYRCSVRLDDFGQGPWLLTVVGWGKSDDNADQLWISPVKLTAIRARPGATLDMVRLKPLP